MCLHSLVLPAMSFAPRLPAGIGCSRRRRSGWDCAPGYSLCRALARQLPGVCPGLSPHPHPLGDLVSCVFLMRWCAQDLPCSVLIPHAGTSCGMWWPMSCR
uniref:Uncharacterized protein n=1 Tax=Amazona collaria TaxID=241587 RepID=A0A8B9GIN5_9PSIT